MKIYQRFVADLDSGGEKLSDQLSEVDLSDPEDVKVLMPEQGSDILAHFGQDNFLSRYKNYKAHLAEWRQQYPHLAAVDLRYEHQVVLEMEKGTQMAASTAPAAKSADTPEATEATPKPAAKAAAASRGSEAPRESADSGGEPMSERADNLITVLDAGSNKIRVLVADLNEGALRYRGHGVVDAIGMRKGLIAELQPAIKAITTAANLAEAAARCTIETCVVGIGGAHVRGVNSRGGISLGYAPARDYPRRCARGGRSRSLRLAARRSRSDPPAAAAVHSRRAAGHSRSGGHGRQSAGSEPAHLHLLRQRLAERRHLRQPGRP